MFAGLLVNCTTYRIDAAIQAIQCPRYMPVAVATPYQDLRAYRRTLRSDMPMCIAMLQNQAKNIVCQNVNLTCPGSGSPPFQMSVSAFPQKPSSESMPSWRSPTMPKPMNTTTIHGAAMFATRATTLYP